LSRIGRLLSEVRAWCTVGYELLCAYVSAVSSQDEDALRANVPTTEELKADARLYEREQRAGMGDD
jgi:hypothetical protein